MQRNLKIFCILMALCMVLCGCSAEQPAAEVPPESDAPVNEQPAPEPEPAIQPQEPSVSEPAPEPEPEPEPISIRITAAGDNLLHNTVSYASALPEGGYDFAPVYENIAKIIENSDIAFVNQEVMLTGEVSAYPNLAAPGENADALIGAGFNVINLATNHTLDKGVKGLEACLENVHARPFDAVLGAFRTEEESTSRCVLEKQGIRFGFLSYTYGLNGYQLPADKQWMISLIDEVKIKADLAALRPEESSGRFRRAGG